EPRRLRPRWRRRGGHPRPGLLARPRKPPAGELRADAARPCAGDPLSPRPRDLAHPRPPVVRDLPALVAGGRDPRLASLRMARLLALCAVVLLTACGASTSGSDSKLHVADSSERLMLLLHENGVEVTTTRNQKPAPLGKAWHAFERFAALPVADAVDDAFLFQATVQYSGDAWGRTFILDFGRQYAPKGGGDMQQVHLIAYFRARVFDEIRSQIRVVSCADELTSTPTPSCDGLCTYAGQSTAMLGSPCSIVPSVMAG